MTDINVAIIGELREFLVSVTKNKDLIRHFRQSDKDFIRNRKLPFERLVLLIVKLCKKTLSLEIEKFFEEIDVSMPCSVSAFTQQRNKLGASFFYFWNMVLWLNFYSLYNQAAKRWRGYRVIAADGSSVSLINNKVLSEHFGGQANQHTSFILGKSFYHYDVLNELILHSRLGPYRYCELDMAYDGIDLLKEDMLMIYDRNFCNYKMVALHLWQEKEIKFVIRAKETQKIVRSFIESQKESDIVALSPGTSAIKGLRKSGFIITKDRVVHVRLVRVQLENTVEVLMTNLWEEQGYSAAEFKDIYFMRWGVETNIAFQKIVLQLEAFSGLTVQSVLQDFYATVFVSNLHALLIKDAQQTVDNLTHRKHPVKINKNKSMGRLKTKLISLFIHNNVREILQTLHNHFIKDVSLIRKGRKFERIRKNIQSRSKFRTFTNFKPSY
jgi:hypothetical protein